MKIRDLITSGAVSVSAEESVAHAARLMAQYNIGSLPVRSAGGRLCGIVTDRDLTLRCIAGGLAPDATAVRRVMTAHPFTLCGDCDAEEGARLMAQRQIRRLPVTDPGGRLCGMFSLSDLARQRGCEAKAAECLKEISKNIKNWEKNI